MIPKLVKIHNIVHLTSFHQILALTSRKHIFFVLRFLSSTQKNCAAETKFPSCSQTKAFGNVAENFFGRTRRQKTIWNFYFLVWASPRCHFEFSLKKEKIAGWERNLTPRTQQYKFAYIEMITAKMWRRYKNIRIRNRQKTIK